MPWDNINSDKRSFYTELGEKHLSDIFYYSDGLLYYNYDNPYRKNIYKGAKVPLVLDGRGYHQVGHLGKYLRYHRIVWEVMKGKIPEGLVVDHINRNRLDNRIENLRLLDRFDSAQNVGFRVDNSSGFKGVIWHPSSNKWRAYLIYKGERINVGYFEDKIEAAKAYDNKLLELVGDKSQTNQKLGLL